MRPPRPGGTHGAASSPGGGQLRAGHPRPQPPATSSARRPSTPTRQWRSGTPARSAPLGLGEALLVGPHEHLVADPETARAKALRALGHPGGARPQPGLALCWHLGSQDAPPGAVRHGRRVVKPGAGPANESAARGGRLPRPRLPRRVAGRRWATRAAGRPGTGRGVGRPARPRVAIPERGRTPNLVVVLIRSDRLQGGQGLPRHRGAGGPRVRARHRPVPHRGPAVPRAAPPGAWDEAEGGCGGCSSGPATRGRTWSTRWPSSAGSSPGAVTPRRDPDRPLWRLASDLRGPEDGHRRRGADRGGLAGGDDDGCGPRRRAAGGRRPRPTCRRGAALPALGERVSVHGYPPLRRRIKRLGGRGQGLDRQPYHQGAGADRGPTCQVPAWSCWRLGRGRPAWSAGGCARARGSRAGRGHTGNPGQ